MFGRTAGGPAAPHGFTQGTGRRQDLFRGSRGQFVHPALNEGQCRLKLLQRLVLGRRSLRHEDALGQGLLDAFGVARIEVAGQFLDAGGIDVDAAGVGLDGAQQVAAQPRNLHEEPCVRGLPDGQEQPDVVFGEGQAFAEGRDVRRQECHLEVGERDPDVGGAHNVL